MGIRRRMPRPPRDPEGPEVEDLLDRFRKGDGSAFQDIVGAYQERVIQFFYRLCWDRDRAEDFAQELFLRLLRGAKNYRPEGRLSTFVFRIATNLWIDHYRSVRPHPRLYSLDQPVLADETPLGSQAAAPSVTPVQQAIDDEEKARLRAALASLTEPHRLVFELAVYQELPYQEVATVLGIPVGTVKSRMHNSVRALKEMLGERGDAGEPSGRAQQDARGDAAYGHPRRAEVAS